MSSNFACGCPALHQVQKSAKHYTEAALDEVTLLTEIRDGDQDNTKCCVRLWDSFEHHGPNGKHICMVFEVSPGASKARQQLRAVPTEPTQCAVITCMRQPT